MNFLTFFVLLYTDNKMVWKAQLISMDVREPRSQRWHELYQAPKMSNPDLWYIRVVC